MTRLSLPPRRSRRDSRADERGVTLTELTIVGVLATLIMLGLTGFYLNSQKVWTDGSTQALAQRDATLLVEQLRLRVHGARAAVVSAQDVDHDVLTLDYETGSTVQIQCNSLDQRVHALANGTTDLGPIVETPVTCLHFATYSSMVDLSLAELRTANGDTVRIASRFALLGGGL